MSLLDAPSVDEVAAHFAGALQQAQRGDAPYTHWKMRDVLPEKLSVGILLLPVAPPVLGRTDGTRATYNSQRCFITPRLRARFPACAVLADALQRPDVARLVGQTFGIEVAGSYARAEYIQDLDGAWLEPHCDIPEKLFSMVIYFFTGPEAENWGTDIYDADRKWIGRAPGEFNTGVTFIPGPNTWHGFEPRPIEGVRRLMEINYVRPGWRDREQLCFPGSPICLT